MIFLDHNATTPIAHEVVEAMAPYLSSHWGNPSSLYRFGGMAHQAMKQARLSIAISLNCNPNEVVFTSGATEGNNTAIHSALYSSQGKRHIVTSLTEHSAVLNYCKYLETHHGIEVTKLPVDEKGIISLEALEKAIRPDTFLVSLMWANNETGVINPIREIAEICHSASVLFHCDAVQAFGKIPVNLKSIGIDFITISGHKICASKGIGALIVRENIPFTPFIYGGHQENSRRGGTENVPFIVSLGVAAKIASEKISEWTRILELRDWFEQEIKQLIPSAHVHAKTAERLPNTSNIHIPGVDGDAVVTYMDRKGICISSGSACLERAQTPSHVILAMTSSHEKATESIRVSLGTETTKEDIQTLLEELTSFYSINSYSSSVAISCSVPKFKRNSL